MSVIAHGISQSQISLYRKCPYAYYLSYVKGYKAMGFNPDIMEVGSRVHDAIDIYYKNLFDGQSTKEEILKSVYSVLREAWDPMLNADYLKKAFVCLENFAELEEKELKNNGHAKPMSELDLRHDGFRGKIDRFEPVGMNIGDFKTNTMASVSYEYKMQGAIYCYLVEQEFKQKPKAFNLYFLYPNEIRTIKANSLDGILEEAKIYRDMIKDSFKMDIFDKKPRTATGCRYCDFRFYCARNEYGKKH
jgi:CRISPR/Cas system-associated exonuclease Cas4 (RecB family)